MESGWHYQWIFLLQSEALLLHCVAKLQAITLTSLHLVPHGSRMHRANYILLFLLTCNVFHNQIIARPFKLKLNRFFFFGRGCSLLWNNVPKLLPQNTRGIFFFPFLPLFLSLRTFCKNYQSESMRIIAWGRKKRNVHDKNLSASKYSHMKRATKHAVESPNEGRSPDWRRWDAATWLNQPACARRSHLLSQLSSHMRNATDVGPRSPKYSTSS